jgi:creatinine amidohydrolase
LQYGEMRWPQTEANRHRVVVAPLGALEQHGHHLPMLTDTLIISEIAKRAEADLPNEALFLPTLWIGASDHHLAFPGTLSLSADHYQKVIENLLESLIAGGFRRILLLNGHGGNTTPCHQAMFTVQHRRRTDPELFITFASWWQIARERIALIEGLQSVDINHACEQETSMILRSHPALADMAEARGAGIPFDSEFYCPDFSRPSRVDVARSFEQLSRTGAFGRPEIGTPEKGEALYAAAAGEVVLFVRELVKWAPIDPS